MNSRLIKLLSGVVIAILLGFATMPLSSFLCSLFGAKAPSGASVATSGTVMAPSAPSPDETKGVTIGEDGAISANEADDSGMDAISQDDDAWGNDGGDGLVERDVDSYMPSDPPAGELKPIAEAKEIPEIPEEQVVPGVSDTSRNNQLARNAKRLAGLYQKAEKKEKGVTGFTSDDYPADMWKKPETIYQDLCEKVLGKIRTEEAMWTFLEDPANRLDLARLTLIRKVGFDGLRQVASQKMGGTMLFHLTSDLDWMTGLLYSGPSDRLEQGLINMARIYARYSEDMSNPVARRVATTTATEFAREGWPEKEMMERFAYYYGSYRAEKLNVIFDTLQYWETRLVTGCTEYNGWGSARSLTWQRDNVRLPAEGYLGANSQLEYRLRNVAGDSVFSAEYLAPILKYTKNITAWAHREIGGVCGALSHYGAYGALAAGIPAMTMGEPGHCAYIVRIGKEWQKSYSIYWQHGMHKTFWGLHDWDFLILMQDLYEDRYATLVSDQFLALAEFCASRKMMKSAFACYDAALAAQPLNWPAWISCASYLKQKAPENKEKWKELHDRAINTLAVKFHNATAQLFTRYIYPNLLPLVPDRKERNKMYAAFFRQCKDFGTNRWNISPLLDGQMSGCTTPQDQIAYMKDALKMLMDKPAYSGAVLSWGLEFIAHMPGSDAENAKMQEEFSDLIVSAMSRARTTKKEIDATWQALGEAIYTAASNGDRRTFQAIGRLAMRKCKKKFPKNRFKFRAFPGRVVSAKGLIQTATTLSPSQMPQCCLHYAVLQKTGGLIPAKFGGEAGMVVELEDTCQLSGMVCLFKENVKNDRAFKVEVSEDGQNWSSSRASIQVAGAIIRADMRQPKPCARFVRLLRDGDKWESEIVGFYVYGKPLKKESKP